MMDAGRDRQAWDDRAALLAAVLNCNPFRTKPVEPDDLNPYKRKARAAARDQQKIRLPLSMLGAALGLNVHDQRPDSGQLQPRIGGP